MIEQVAELFVERRGAAAERPAMTSAKRVLAVDACAIERRIAQLLASLEESAPLSLGLVRADRLASVPPLAVFDAIWLFVDGDADEAYCGLIAAELKLKHGVAVSTIGCGGDGRDGWTVLGADAVGACPPWRRRAANAAARATLLGLLGAGEERL